MKAVSVFSVFLLFHAQLSYSASVQRFKRDTPEDAVEAIKQIVKEEVDLVNAVLKETPDTDPYYNIHRYWGRFLYILNEKNEGTLCIAKYRDLMDAFTMAIGSYEYPHRNAEEEETLKLFYKHGLEEHITRNRVKLEELSFDYLKSEDLKYLNKSIIEERC